MLKKLVKNENIWYALIFSLLFFALLGYVSDFYYDLNDDVLMKDILAGNYTGEPESRNIQMLYPLSFFLSCLYRLFSGVPWYGVFLCGCHVLCVFLVTERILEFCQGKFKKVMILSAEALFLTAYVLRDFVFVQYTFTSAVLASTAAFLVMTGQKKYRSEEKYLLQGCYAGIILAILAFLLRSEMLLLLLPFLCAAGIFRWAEESKPFLSKNHVKKYLLTACFLFSGLIVCQIIHNWWGYRSSEWRDFQAFFNSRTELYDFQTIPTYQDNWEFYESIGISKSRQVLLENYNFGVDEELNANCLKKITQYAVKLKREQSDFWDTCREAMENYKYRTFHETDYPWNLAVLVMYMGMFLVLCRGAFSSLWKLVFLGFLRTGVWMFILFRGRAPERITHSLYLMEFMLLLALLLAEIHKKKRKTINICIGTVTFLVILALIAVPGSVQKTWKEYQNREDINSRMQALQSYIYQRHENFYFIDVYSTVAYSEKLFKKEPQRLANYDLMGGWAAKSPLTRKKLKTFQIENIEDAILSRSDVFVIVQSPESPNLPKLAEWMTAYYKEKGQNVYLQKKDEVYADNEAVFTVYCVEKK